MEQNRGIVDGAGTTHDVVDYYFHQDDLFNVVLVTDESGGAVERYEYGDYGAPFYYDGSGDWISYSVLNNTRLFNGREWDQETRFYYYRTRYMEPTMGRFTTRDTIGVWGDAGNAGSALCFAATRPTVALDPLGLKSYRQEFALYYEIIRVHGPGNSRTRGRMEGEFAFDYWCHPDGSAGAGHAFITHSNAVGALDSWSVSFFVGYYNQQKAEVESWVIMEPRVVDGKATKSFKLLVDVSWFSIEGLFGGLGIGSLSIDFGISTSSRFLKAWSRYEFEISCPPCSAGSSPSAKVTSRQLLSASGSEKIYPGSGAAVEYWEAPYFRDSRVGSRP